MDLSWMAWTWPTAALFILIALSIAALGVWALFAPGGDRRLGVVRLNTTRGDRLFIAWLGSGFTGLGWLAACGAPLGVRWGCPRCGGFACFAGFSR